MTRDKVIIASTKVSIIDEENTKRGVIITIEYFGECEHRGEIIFQFYKGHVKTCHNCLPNGELRDIDDIFRD